MSLDDFSFSSVSFSSEVGTVLNFFAYFFVSRQKSKWGLGQSPIIKYLKIKNINVLTIFLSCTKANYTKRVSKRCRIDAPEAGVSEIEHFTENRMLLWTNASTCLSIFMNF